MVSALDESERHVRAAQAPEQLDGMGGGHVRIRLALQDADGARDVESFVQHQVLAAILDQAAGDGIGLAIGGRAQPHALLVQLAAHLVGELVPHQVRRHVGGRCQQHEAPDALGGQRVGALQVAVDQQGEPAAHRGAHQDARPLAVGEDHVDGLLQPFRDRAVDEQSARCAVAGIVEAQAGAAGFARQGCQGLRLGALHVGLVAAQPDEAAAAEIVLAIGAEGDGRAVG